MLPRLGLGTVYRNLKRLAEEGLAPRLIEVEEGLGREEQCRRAIRTLIAAGEPFERLEGLPELDPARAFLDRVRERRVPVPRSALDWIAAGEVSEFSASAPQARLVHDAGGVRANLQMIR